MGTPSPPAIHPRNGQPAEHVGTEDGRLGIPKQSKPQTAGATGALRLQERFRSGGGSPNVGRTTGGEAPHASERLVAWKMLPLENEASIIDF